jgi:hypothetical protein
MFWQRHTSAIYKITFGHRFYIGRSQLVYQRWLAHERNINIALSQYPDLNMRDYGYYINLIRYLLENPNINVGYIEVIRQCESFYELCQAENVILNDFVGNPDCFNRSFVMVEPNCPNIPLIQESFYEFYRWFYNPKYDMEVMETQHISRKGHDLFGKVKSGPILERKIILQQIIDKYGILR